MSGGSVLVTGASRGIGAACVTELTRRGLGVLAGVRRDEDAERLRDAGVTPLLLDVTDPAQVAAAAVRVQELLAGGRLVGVVSNAGVLLSGPLEHVSLDELRRQLEVNVVGALGVVQAFLPLLRASRGRIVVLGSTSGRVAGRFVGPYAASKAALASITGVLRLELSDAGVDVSLVEPGVVGTSLWEREAAAQDHWTATLPPQGSAYYGARAAGRRAKLADLERGGLDPAVVAVVVAEALVSPRPRPRYVVGRRARLTVALARVLPERALVRLQS